MALLDTHIIERQVLEIEVDNKTQASDIQDRVSRIYQTEVMPMLDSLFSSYNLTEKSISIDHLEVDIGNLNQDNLEEDFLRQLKIQLEEIFTPLVYKAKNNQAQKGVRVKPIGNRQRGGINVFYTYLKKGVFPWWARAEDRQLETLIKSFVALDWSSAHQQTKFYDLIQHKDERRRMLEILPENDLKKIFLSIDRSLATKVFDIQKDLIKCFDVIFDQAYDKRIFALYAMDQMVEDFFKHKKSMTTKMAEAQYAQELLFYLLRQKGESSFVPITVKALNRVATIPQSGFSIFQKKEYLLQIKEGIPVKNQPLTKDKASNSLSPLNAAPKITANRTSVQNEISEIEKSEIYHVGVVLLWPFLQIFFRELGLLNGSEFKQEETQWKAIHLLYFLATGKETSEEHELGLMKLLCNQPLSSFVPAHFELTETEKEECIHLLETVIKNWPVLKKTSVDGFRKAFIQREGLLQKDSRNWMIGIERKAHDILLDRLNWSISNIKLPWNDYLIQVKW